MFCIFSCRLIQLIEQIVWSLFLPQKPYHINEDTNTPVLSFKNRCGPPAASNINTYPHTQAEDMPHGKYGTNDDVQGLKPVDENNAHAVHKHAHVQKTHSSSTTQKTKLDACSRNSVVAPTHVVQDVAQINGSTKEEYGVVNVSTKEEYGVVERQLARDVTRTGKIAPHNQPLSRREARGGSLGPSGDHVYAADILKRLQRLEEFQHVHTMGTVKVRPIVSWAIDT